jgi:hypothetical protein
MKIDKQLIEKEIERRVGFRLEEIRSQFKMHLTVAELVDKHSYGHIQCRAYLKAWKDVHVVLDKELSMGTPYDGSLVERTWKRKEKAVNKISERLLKRGAREHDHLKSFVNDCIETVIYTK